MKVLIIPTWYPNGEDKLMGLYHKEFCEELNNNQIGSDMIFIDRQRIKKPIKYLFMKKWEIVEENNYRVYIQKMLNLSKISYALMMKIYIKKLDCVLKKYLKTNSKPDILHAMVTSPAGYAACKIGEKYNIPVVVTEHSSVIKRFFEDDKFKKYGNYVIKHSTYSTVSNYMKEYMLKYTDTCHIIPNMVKTSIFDSCVNRKIKDKFNLVSVCALREGKNLDTAFKAIKRLIDEGMNIHYDIIGEGFKQDYYKKCAKDMKVEEYVSFLGKKDKKEISEIFKREHALLICSNLETFAIPGIEALASGLPVITTDCMGPTEYIDKKTGIICKVDDDKDMAYAIKKLYTNYDKYDVKELKKRAKKYSCEEVVKIAKKIYKEVVDK